MGIIKSIKSMFSNNISIDVSKVNGIVFPYIPKGGKIKINSKLIVPENFSCVLGYSGKPLDCFASGEFFLTPATLPQCCKKLKIHKTDKNNKIKKAFKADVYFVSQLSQTLEWKTLEKAELGQKLSGIFTVGAVGKMEYVVNNASKLIENLLGEFAYLRNGEAEKILKIWISDSVVRTLNKYNFALSEFMSDNPVICENVKTGVSQILSKFGITVKEFEIDEFVLPRKYHKQYRANKNKAEKEESKEVEQEKTEIEQPELIENDENAEIEKAIVCKVDGDDFSYSPFGDFVIEQAETRNVSTNEKEDNLHQDIQQKNHEEIEFVDLDIDKLIHNSKNTTRCINCGAENEKDAIHCKDCNNRL